MPERVDSRHLLRCFADVLDYPTPALLETIRQCRRLTAPLSAEASALLEPLERFVERTSSARWEELYTYTFELDAVCHPYVGHHLFGESYKRSALLVGLQEQYKVHGLVVEKELPDHLCLMLRFLALCRDELLARDVACEALIPALERMAPGQTTPGPVAGSAARHLARPYGGVLRALQMVLRALYPELPAPSPGLAAAEQAPLVPAGD